MRTLVLVCAAALVGCGGGSKNRQGPATDLPRPVPNACNGTNPSACYESKRTQCVAGKVWTIDMNRLGRLTVSASGALRMTHAGATLFGHGGKRWLACTECVDAPTKKLCMPYEFPVQLSGSYDDSCTQKDAAGAPWNGRASRVRTITCGDASDRTVFRLRYVPTLTAVRDALVSAGVVKRNSALSTLDGLTVQMHANQRRLFQLDRIGLSDCTVFLYPGSVPRVTEPSRFTELDKLMPPLRRDFSKAGRAMVDLMMAESVRRATLSIGRECLGPGVPIAHDAVERCLAKRPDLKAKFRATVMAAASELAAKQSKNFDKLLQSRLLWPLCRHYAGKLHKP